MNRFQWRAVEVVFFGVLIPLAGIVTLLAFLTVSCGTPQDTDGTHKGTHQHGGAHVDPKFAAIQPVIARACGECHNGDEQRALDTPARLAGAKGRIESGNMPPGGAIDPADKAALLSF